MPCTPWASLHELWAARNHLQPLADRAESPFLGIDWLVSAAEAFHGRDERRSITTATATAFNWNGWPLDDRFDPQVGFLRRAASLVRFVYTDERDTLTRGLPDLKNRAFVVKINRLLFF